MTENQDRGAWSSRIGFILAGAGSAIGLGNIWRFPYVTGENGGAAFVLIYILCVFLIGFPVMIAELSLGRKTKKNPVGMFKALVPGSPWKYVGGLGVLTGLVIFSWYSVIAGWIVGYLYKIYLQVLFLPLLYLIMVYLQYYKQNKRKREEYDMILFLIYKLIYDYTFYTMMLLVPKYVYCILILLIVDSKIFPLYSHLIYFLYDDIN